MTTIRDGATFEIQDGTDYIFKSPGTDEVLVNSFEGFSTRTVIEAGVVDFEIPLNGPSNLKRIYFIADQSLTIKLATPGFTVLNAQPFTTVEDVGSFLATEDVTAIYVSNPGLTDAVLKLGAAGDDSIAPPSPGPVVINNDLVVNGKVTISGLIDPPTGLQLAPQDAPGVTALPNDTIFIDDADDLVKFKNGSGVISSLGGGGGGVTSVSGTAPVVSSGGATPAISMPVATALADGYLSSANFSVFNNKQAAGNYITDLTGDVTASGPGSAGATVVQVDGVPAGDISSAVTVVQAAVSTSDPDTLALRDAQGDIFFNDVTSEGIMYVSGDGIQSTTSELKLQSSGQNANVLVQDLNIYLNPDPASSVIIQGKVDMSGNEVQNALDPTAAQSLATRAFVERGIDPSLYFAPPTEDFTQYTAIADTTPAGWGFASAGGSPVTPIITSVGVAGHPGVAQFATGATGDFVSLYHPFWELSVGSGEITWEAVLRVDNLSTASDEYNLKFGMALSASTLAGLYTGAAPRPRSAIYFNYDRTASVNWRINSTDTTTNTVTTTGTAVAAATFTKFKLVVNAAGTSVEFFIGGSSVGTISTNINTGTRIPFFAMYRTSDSGFGNITVDVDYLKVRQAFTSAR